MGKAKKRKRKHRHESDDEKGEGPRELEVSADSTEGTVEHRTEVDLEQLTTDTPAKRKKHKHKTRRDNGHDMVTPREDARSSQELESDRQKSCAVAVNGKKTKRHKQTEVEDQSELPFVKKKKHKL